MALKILRKPEKALLDLEDPESGLFPVNHIFEPEFHQAEYVNPCEQTAGKKGAFQVGAKTKLAREPCRGTQPAYADQEDDPDSLEWEGMITRTGTRLDSSDGTMNVCALKSNCVRFGFIDTGLARSVSREFYEKKKAKAGVEKNDVLVNSTGDGTIGRVAVFNYEFPAVVDGHITILRYKNPKYAWYVAAYLLSDSGQKQLYRYINGSSGQVEIYPQDIARVWVEPNSKKVMTEIAKTFRDACDKHDEFYMDMRTALGKF